MFCRCFFVITFYFYFVLFVQLSFWANSVLWCFEFKSDIRHFESLSASDRNILVLQWSPISPRFVALCSTCPCNMVDLCYSCPRCSQGAILCVGASWVLVGRLAAWRRDSVVISTSVFGWRTFPDLGLIYSVTPKKLANFFCTL